VVDDSADYETQKLGRLTSGARYRTYVQNLSIDNDNLLCDIEAGSGGSGAGGSAASNKSWLGGETQKRPATLAVSVCHRLASGYRGPEGPEV
jgi:hypothetical protein